MRYSDFIEVNHKFQSSVNLEYDLNKIEKIQGYIPTEQSVKILGEFLRSYYYSAESQNRAMVLIGPYGRGKSHLILVLTALTSLDIIAEDKKAARKIQLELCKKISLVNKEIGALAKLVVDTGKRTLPVIINSNSTDINQSFLVALNSALTRAGLESLLPDTYFHAALALIFKWEEGFPEAISKLQGELRRHKETLENLKTRLAQFDQGAYRLFCDSYPAVAAGTEFNPLTNMDVVKLYIAVSNALQEQTEYCGLSIVFDEFSKFLEANLDKSKMLNFKIIQDMAEAAARSKEAQIHFTCITHKDILDYSSSDSFKTVEGRFKKIWFVSSSEQSYELIANAIIKKKGFSSFKQTYSSQFKATADQAARVSVFTDLSQEAFEFKLVEGCYPLSPLSAYALLHVSELVGQNERTLFTFLAQSGPNTLRAFIDEDYDEPTWISIDYIYDYFEELFKTEVFNTSVHSIWAKTDSALRQINNVEQKRILKAIAIINIIRDERLKPVPAHIKAALLMKDKVFKVAVSVLLQKHILFQRDSSEYVLLTANGVDAQKSVDLYVKTSLPKINVCDTLSKVCNLGFVIPREYNDRFGILRCFKVMFMDADAFSAYKNANQLLSDYPFDGLIINIVNSENVSLNQVKKKIQSFSDSPQIVICTSSQPFSCEILLKQYEAALYLLNHSKDSHFIEELETLSEDIERRIQGIVHVMYAPSSEYSSFITGAKKLHVTRQVELNREISAICGQCYSLTPIVNNEMVNKNSLNTQNYKGRDLVIRWILQHSNDNIIPCMAGAGPEVSIFKSAFKHTGLDKSALVADEGMNSALKEIEDFIRGSEKNKSNFQTLYQTLTLPPYGMRKGIIPLYIAYVLRQYKENIVLYFKGKEVELSSAALSNLNDAPENYEVLIEAGTSEKTAYLDELHLLFLQYEDSSVPSINRVYSIVKSMQNWIRSLPEYTKSYKYYIENGESIQTSQAINCIRSELLKFELNSSELLFKTWPEKLTEKGNLSECLACINESKQILDEHLSNFKFELTKKLTALFVPGYLGGLTRAVISWYEKLPGPTKAHVFDANLNSLLTLASTIRSYDDEVLLNSLVTIFVSIAIEDWNDDLSNAFIRKVSDAIGKINDYTDSGSLDGESGHFSISIGNVNIEKNFTSKSISPLGKTAFNNLKAVFDEYNESLEPDDQLAILVKLIVEIVK